MRLRRNTFAAAIRSASEIVRCFAAGTADGGPPSFSRSSARDHYDVVTVHAAETFRTLRNCQCRHMATSHLGHLGCSTHQSAVVKAVAAVVHRWVDPLAVAPGGQPAYSACRRNRAPHTPERSLRLWV
jgi:hypothetical protein